MLRIITALCIASATGSSLAQDIIVVPDDIASLEDALNPAISGIDPGDIIVLRDDFTHFGSFDVTVPDLTIRALAGRSPVLDANEFGGGGIGGFNFDLLVENSVFQENNANSGGAIFYDSNVNEVLLIEDSVFEGNTCIERGCAFLMRDAGQASFKNTRLAGNTAIGRAGSHAGAIFIDTVRDTAFNGCDFEANLANGEGGAILIGMATVDIVNSTFVDNIANSGDAIRGINSNELRIFNNIFAGHGPAAPDESPTFPRFHKKPRFSR